MSTVIVGLIAIGAVLWGLRQRRTIRRLERLIKWHETIIFDQKAEMIRLEENATLWFDFSDGFDKPPKRIKM